ARRRPWLPSPRTARRRFGLAQWDAHRGRVAAGSNVHAALVVGASMVGQVVARIAGRAIAIVGIAQEATADVVGVRRAEAIGSALIRAACAAFGGRAGVAAFGAEGRHARAGRRVDFFAGAALERRWIDAAVRRRRPAFEAETRPMCGVRRAMAGGRSAEHVVAKVGAGAVAAFVPVSVAIAIAMAMAFAIALSVAVALAAAAFGVGGVDAADRERPEAAHDGRIDERSTRRSACERARQPIEVVPVHVRSLNDCRG
ncbi:MAG TPA: hypothetical protein VFI22_05995, partial [Thermomicrobiales bacterium]|nr:hypothetical protein [Thermomicrobiales bacterium]